MIGSLRGKLTEKRPNQILLDVGGVGYQVQIPLSTFTNLGALHDEATLLIHTHVREDQLALYGFLTSREKQCFELLISASGVGPSLALKILSGMGLEELIPAIRKGDLVQLVRIPGVGRKTAERIVVELRDKLAVVDVADSGKAGDAIAARVGCGFRAGESWLRRACRWKRRSRNRAPPAAAISKRFCAQRCRFWETPRCRKARGQAARSDDRVAGRYCIRPMTDHKVESFPAGRPTTTRASTRASVRTVSTDYIGQDRVKENLKIAVEAARNRGEALDHVLLYGPPGLGKTTLAQILANEMGSAIKVSSGPLLEKKGRPHGGADVTRAARFLLPR